MVRFDEEALICDLAETYQIYDYKQLPVELVAVFSCGLRENSRIKMKMNGQQINLDSMLLAGISDKLSVLLWQRTKDGEKGKNKPRLILDSFINETQEKSEIVFESGEDFEKARKKIISGGEE